MDFDYVIRFRQCITVTDVQGARRMVADWVLEAGHLRKLPKALVTADSTQVGAVVCVKKKGMKEPLCLAICLEQASAAEMVALYSRRFSIEEEFQDIRDLRFGMGLSWVRIAELVERFAQLVCAQSVFRESFGLL